MNACFFEKSSFLRVTILTQKVLNNIISVFKPFLVKCVRKIKGKVRRMFVINFKSITFNTLKPYAIAIVSSGIVEPEKFGML